MREHIYTVSKGNDVLPEFVGKDVSLQRFTSLREALDAKNPKGEQVYEDEQALLNAAESQRLIKMRSVARDVLGRRPEKGKESEYIKPTLIEAALAANAVTVNARGEAAAPKAKTPKGKQQTAARTSGQKLFDKMAADEQFRSRMFKALDNQAEYEAWAAAVDEEKVWQKAEAAAAAAETAPTA